MSAENQSNEPSRAERAAVAHANCSVAILGTALTLCAFLFVVRSWVVGYDWSLSLAMIAGLPKLLAAAFHDFLYVAGITAFFLVLLWIARKSVCSMRIVCGLFLVVALLSLAAAYGNVQFVKVVGRPFNYQWYYYSGFLKSTEAKNAIGASLSPRTGWLALCAAIGMLVAAWVVSRAIGATRRKHLRGWRLAFCVVGVCVVYFPLAAWCVTKLPWNNGKLENSIVAFVRSAVFASDPSFFTMKTSVGPEDFLAVMDRKPEAPLKPFRPATPIRNVLLFVLESVPTEYVEVYGSKYPVTPTLSRYRKHSMLFRRIYATAPSTNKSMVSLLCGIYPSISYLSLTQEDPSANLASLSSELKERGYRTAFFSASDNQYQSLDKFLAHRSFDLIYDYRSKECGRGTFIDPSGNKFFLNGMDDECATDSLIDWVNANPHAPFFAMQWTMMTHYPYFVSEAETDFGVKDPYLNRYLNALRRGDRCLGKILSALEAKGLADSTLVVVVGDHGEAFGRHDQYTHACKIYEENVHIPLLLINPQLFHGEEETALGNMADIAPTVLHVLGLPLPGEWQGRSLLGEDRRERVYFFATWSEYLFGYREGNRKCIFNASENRYEVYDLSSDPLEETNLASRSPELVKMIPQRLAAWVQYQDRLMKRSGQQVSHGADAAKDP